MKVLYIDGMFGIAGDMMVAALIDLGVPFEHIKKQINALALPEAVDIRTEQILRRGMRGNRFIVSIEGEDGATQPVYHHHDHHHHHHHHDNHHDHHHSHEHRRYAEIRSLLDRSPLNPEVRTLAQKIFLVLAKAEAKAHGVAVEDVQFHEVGAVDSIIDTVAAAAGIAWLGVDTVYVSPLPMGGGFIETAHGRLAVPAPATVELLQGFVVHTSITTGERVTPTGAAIVASCAEPLSKIPAMTIESVGYGAGKADFGDGPNMVRLICGTVIDTETSELFELSCTIDDCTGEQIGFLQERLLNDGALDVWGVPVQMKKQRPGVVVSALVSSALLGQAIACIQEESGTLGVRWHAVSRQCVDRQVVEQSTSLGSVRFKVSPLGVKPEYDDCRRIAERDGLPLRVVQAQLLREFHHGDC